MRIDDRQGKPDGFPAGQTQLRGHMYKYDEYNREERFICSHLFRLLHEPYDNYRALRKFLGKENFNGPFKLR